MKILCKLFGCKFNIIEKTMMEIKNVAQNREGFLKDKIICKRCKTEYSLKR